MISYRFSTNSRLDFTPSDNQRSHPCTFSRGRSHMTTLQGHRRRVDGRDIRDLAAVQRRMSIFRTGQPFGTGKASKPVKASTDCGNQSVRQRLSIRTHILEDDWGKCLRRGKNLETEGGRKTKQERSAGWSSSTTYYYLASDECSATLFTLLSQVPRSKEPSLKSPTLPTNIKTYPKSSTGSFPSV